MSTGVPSEQSIIDSTSRPSMDRAGLYIHVPFCLSKCGYCDFYSVVVDSAGVSAAITGIVAELRNRLKRFSGMVSTCYIGGGTPTVINGSELARLLEAVGEQVDVYRVEEFTIEANPATVGPEKARLLAEFGVNRVCMGVQSFHAGELAFLERGHSPEDIVPAVAELREVGISNIGLDLIFGIGGQTAESWRESLLRAIELGPTHISCYGLTYEPETRLTARLRKGEFEACNEKLEADLYLQAVEILEGHGYEHYEISNFALPGCRCRHNMTYWTHRPYLGVGPSAAGFVGGLRYRNVANVEEYVRQIEKMGAAEEYSEVLSNVALASEMIMLQLRLADGLDVGRLIRETGVDIAAIGGEVLEGFRGAGFVEFGRDRIGLTNRGMLVADGVIRDLCSLIG